MLLPHFNIVSTAILSQVLNGLLLPVILYFMLKLVNNNELMCEHTNSAWFNVVAWATAIIVVVLSLALAWNGLRPQG